MPVSFLFFCRIDLRDWRRLNQCACKIATLCQAACLTLKVKNITERGEMYQFGPVNMTDDTPSTVPPNTASILVGVCDLNGVTRGKRIPSVQADKALSGAMRMPLSVSALDIWGRDIEGSSMIFEDGDGDGVCQPIRPNVVSAPWLGGGVDLVPVWMFTEAGTPSPVDPRHALDAVLKRYAARDLTPVVATELEFYLTPLSGQETFTSEGVLSLHQLNEIAPFLDDVYAACAGHDIPADAAISECGAGQFEINLLHRDDALLAADDAVFFKSIVKGCARAHGYAANFMAKPDGTSAGNGLHVHFSLLDNDERNVFDDGSDQGSDTLRSAVAGVMAALAESTLIFAPHFNSYRRLRPNAHAPTTMTWGYENRTAAVRIPGGSPKARRIEHRVAGADANPYLVLAAVLGAALHGIEYGLAPPAPTDGNSYSSDALQLPSDWGPAISTFETGAIMAEVFLDELREVFVQGKRQEQVRFLDKVTAFEHETYADIL